MKKMTEIQFTSKLPMVILIFSVVCSTISLVVGQNIQACGISDLSYEDYQISLQQINMPGQTSTINEISNIPLHFIIVKDDSGNSPQISNFQEQVNQANIFFEGILQFYICQQTIINSTLYYNLNFNSDEEALYDTFHDENAINVYIVNSITNPASIGVSYLPSQSDENIIVLATGLNVILSHELGHFFGLSHTFNGSFYITNTSCFLPPLNSDCATTGDFICDTPIEPHPNVGCPGGCTQTLCMATCNANTITYDFDKGNVMSYYYNCYSNFTPTQKQVMLTNTFHPNRLFLFDSDEPVCEPVISIPMEGKVERYCVGNTGLTVDPLAIVPLDIEDITNSIICHRITDQNGQYDLAYACDIVSDDVFYNIRPYRESADNPIYLPNNGVSSFDLLLIQRHILGIDFINNKPYGWIAADANNNGAITAFDLILIRKVILGIDDAFDIGSWRFVPSYYLDPQYNFSTSFENNPFTATWNGNGYSRAYLSTATQKSYMDDVDLDALNPDISNENTWSFVGIKTGDVNCSAGLETLSSTNNETNINILPDPHPCLKAGESAIVAVMSHFSGNVLAYQFGLEYDQSVLEITGESAGDIPGFSLDNFGLKKLSAGELKTLWVEPTTAGVSFKDTALFKLHIKAKEDICDITEVFKFSNGLLPVGFYDKNKALANMDISFSVTPDLQIHELLNIYPSPFSSDVHFSFELSKADKVSILLSDSFGNTVYEESDLSVGTNAFTINNTSNLQGSNIYYTLNLGTQIYTGALIKL